MNSSILKASGSIELQQAIDYMEQIISLLKEGRLVVGRDDKSVVITPKEKVEIEVLAENENGFQGLILGLRWKEGDASQMSASDLLLGEVPQLCSLATEEACACSEEDFELAFLKSAGFFQPQTCTPLEAT